MAAVLESLIPVQSAIAKLFNINFVVTYASASSKPGSFEG